MKTAMQELIEYFNERPEYDKTSEGYEIIQKAIELIEKEKEQICNAYTDGLEGPYLGAEEYYYDLYNQSIKKITITENNNQPNL
jgi:hypothetical protein